MVEAVNREFKHNPKSIANHEAAILKMYHLNLDIIRDDFQPLFSLTGKPSNQQPELLRSFLLMSHYRYAGIDEWVAHASATPILCGLIGVTPDSFPGASTHRDFLARLWMADKPNRLKRPKPKPKGKYGNQKQPPKHPGIIAYMVKKALSGEVFKAIPERLLQSIFMKTAVIPSANAGLLGDTQNLNISGDGVCVESHASPYGHKTCTCQGACSCPRSFADSNARWGWDSYHERWFYGHTAYLLSVHNENLKLDLPIYMRFVEASRNDGVTLVAALAHARYLYRDVLGFDSLIADAAHDHYPICDLLKQWHIKPFIALNNHSDNQLQPAGLRLSGNGIPVCAPAVCPVGKLALRATFAKRKRKGYDMVNWGFDWRKYRIKYRCPLLVGKVKSCPYSAQCNKSLYGKTVYLRLASDLRLLTPVPRDSDEWLDVYKLRTASERVNNRILTDYILEPPKRYGKMKIASFAFLDAVNVHLDALVKHGYTTIDSLIA